jgi:transposase
MGRGISVIYDKDISNAKSDLKRTGSLGVRANRLQAIISAYTHGIKKVCEVMDVSRDTMHRWMTNYKQYGVQGLENDHKAARSKLNEEQRIKLKEWIEENPNHTLKELVLKCESEFSLKIGKSSIHRALHQSGYSYITGRKRHYQSNEIEQNDFKKN